MKTTIPSSEFFPFPVFTILQLERNIEQTHGRVVSNPLQEREQPHFSKCQINHLTNLRNIHYNSTACDLLSETHYLHARDARQEWFLITCGPDDLGRETPTHTNTLSGQTQLHENTETGRLND